MRFKEVEMMTNSAENLSKKFAKQEIMHDHTMNSFSFESHAIRL